MELEQVAVPRASSDAPRMAALTAHLLALAVAFAILDRSSAPPGRLELLAIFAALSWFRVAHRVSRVARSFTWRDAALGVIAAGTYQIAFAWAGAASGADVGPADELAGVLYAAGIALGAGCDELRRRFHDRAGNGSRLCEVGPFARVRYPRYLGDLGWSAGWALATRSEAAWLLVVVHAAVVLLVYAPALDRRLAGRYGAEFRAWAARTWRVVPLVY